MDQQINQPTSFKTAQLQFRSPAHFKRRYIQRVATFILDSYQEYYTLYLLTCASSLFLWMIRLRLFGRQIVSGEINHTGWNARNWNCRRAKQKPQGHKNREMQLKLSLEGGGTVLKWYRAGNQNQRKVCTFHLSDVLNILLRAISY